MGIFKQDLRTIAVLAIPVIVETVLQTLLSTTDTFFAGQISDNAIAGIGGTAIIMNMFISLFVAVSIGAVAVVSQAYGAHHPKDVRRAMVQSAFAGTAAGLVAAVAQIVFARQILSGVGLEPAVMAITMPYFYAVAAGTVFLSLQQILSGCLRAVTKTRLPMIATAISNILNIGLNAGFIALGLGMLGLGLATTISRAVGAAILAIEIVRMKTGTPWSRADLHLDGLSMKHILSIGIPAGLEKLAMRTGQLLYNGMIITLGTGAYVAHNVAGTVENYSFIPAVGFGVVLSTLVGNSLGAHDKGSAVHATRTGTIMTCVCMAGIGVLFYLGADAFTSAFTRDPEIQALSARCIRMIALFQIPSAIVTVMPYALQGAGDTKFPLYTTFLGIWGIRLCLGWALAVPGSLGLVGVWYAYCTDVCVRSVLLLLRFIKGPWAEHAWETEKRFEHAGRDAPVNVSVTG